MICFVFQECPKWPTKSPNFAASSHLYQFLVYFSNMEFIENTFSSILSLMSISHKKGTGIKDIKDQKTDIEDIKGEGVSTPFSVFTYVLDLMKAEK